MPMHPHKLAHPASAFYRFKSSLALSDGVSLGHMGEGRTSLLGGLGKLFVYGGADAGAEPGDPAGASKKAEVFLALNASTVGVLWGSEFGVVSFLMRSMFTVREGSTERWADSVACP